MRVLENHAATKVLDPFCGRGTTLYASRFHGIESWGLDSSPVAVAIARAKLANTTPDKALKLAQLLLESINPCEIPAGAFWKWAFHRETLRQVCALREGLQNRNGEAAALLRAVCMGALHGPQQRTIHSYFSNQFPRTFAPKPGYSVRYLQQRNLKPRYFSVIDVIERRLARLEELRHPECIGTKHVIIGDAGRAESFAKIPKGIDLIITSPPYYGMNTYVQDQWMRNWFLGAGTGIEYTNKRQLSHSSPEAFTTALTKVWKNCAAISAPGAKMFIRFGAIASRSIDAKGILLDSLQSSGCWRVSNVRSANSAHEGKRQAAQMGKRQTHASVEYDFVARLDI